jgi:hypothetical protein
MEEPTVFTYYRSFLTVGFSWLERAKWEEIKNATSGAFSLYSRVSLQTTHNPAAHGSAP